MAEFEQHLAQTAERLRPLHQKKTAPGPSDWLAQHDEPGQTFEEYLSSHPVMPDAAHNIIYIQPLGEFSEKHREILKLTADFLGRFFNLPVITKPRLPFSIIPDRARRTHPSWGDRQIHAGYVLDDVLRPRLPRDACVYIGLTASDLWPGRGWNFVFGMASLRERVGVWSLYRYGDPATDDEAFRLCLRRTLKVATHETGHMFSLLHCTAYECNMNGSNHLAESDRCPLWLCPECMAKICRLTGVQPVERYRRLAGFCEDNGLKEELDFFRKSIKALEE
jgi:archaemetzincin